MTLKCFLSVAAAISSAVLLSAGGLPAQSPGAPAKPTPAKPKAGFIRFWNAIPPAAGVALELVMGNTPDGRVLSSASSANYAASYTNLPPGQYPLRVFRAGDRQHAIKSFDLAVKDRGYYTFLVSQQSDGQFTVELIDDTPDPTRTQKNRLTVRQFCQDMMVVVTTTGNYKTDPLPYGKTVTLEDLPDGSVGLSVRATKAGSTSAKTWDAQTDFRLAHHSTLFIVNDIYGRMRARVAVDGPSPEEEAAAAEAARNNVQ